MPRSRTLTLAFLFTPAGVVGAQAASAVRTVVDTVRDTVRVRTVGEVPDVQLRRLVTEWRLGSEQVHADSTFADVSGMAVAADGRVWVWDPATPALWLVDAAGKTLKRVGRRGNGPGEYLKANGVAVVRDGRAALWDGDSRRLNLYDADGKTLRTVTMPFGFCCPSNALTADMQDRVWIRGSVGPLADKRVAEARGAPAYFRVSLTGAVIDTVLAPRLSGDTPPVTATKNDGGGMSSSSRIVPYGTFTMYAVSPVGHVITGQGRPYVVHGATNGRPMRIEGAATPVSVATEERAELRARIEFDLRRVQPNWSWTGEGVPSVKPAYSGISVGQDGRLWVALNVLSERYEPEPPPQANPSPPLHYRARERRWDVFEADGRYFGRVVAPRHFTPYVTRGNSVWGIVRNEDDVPSVVKMRIEPRTSGP